MIVQQSSGSSARSFGLKFTREYFLQLKLTTFLYSEKF